MSALQDKYASVIAAAQTAGVTNLQISEKDDILYVTGNAANSATKDTVWNALGAIDPTYAATDINVDVQVAGLAAGASLTVATDEGNLNIRQEPSTTGEVVGQAAHGEAVTLVEQTSDEWWKVKTAAGEEGYAFSRYLKA